jgi:hypothetical protein
LKVVKYSEKLLRNCLERIIECRNYSDRYSQTVDDVKRFKHQLIRNIKILYGLKRLFTLIKATLGTLHP